MALEKDYKNASIEGNYWRIMFISFDDVSTSFTLGLYASQDARKAGDGILTSKLITAPPLQTADMQKSDPKALCYDLIHNNNVNETEWSGYFADAKNV